MHEEKEAGQTSAGCQCWVTQRNHCTTAISWLLKVSLSGTTSHCALAVATGSLCVCVMLRKKEDGVLLQTGECAVMQHHERAVVRLERLLQHGEELCGRAGGEQLGAQRAVCRAQHMVTHTHTYTDAQAWSGVWTQTGSSGKAGEDAHTGCDVAHVGDVLLQHCARLGHDVPSARRARPAGSVRVDKLLNVCERGGDFVCTLHSGGRVVVFVILPPNTSERRSE